MLGLANLRAYKLKLMFRLLICVIGTWLVSSCSPRNDCLEFALASAGANKEELVKVLRHYEGDSLKYRAACFLIENMPYHGYSEGRALAKYRKYFEIYADGNHDAQQLVDSLKEADGGFSERELVRKRDIEKIDSAYLGQARRIGKIVYVPRNRGNFVREGQCFELFYFGRGKWNSLGRRVADSDVLRYEVPQGALLYLRNHTEGHDERIFEMVEGRQKFW